MMPAYEVLFGGNLNQTREWASTAELPAAPYRMIVDFSAVPDALFYPLVRATGEIALRVGELFDAGDIQSWEWSGKRLILEIGMPAQMGAAPALGVGAVIVLVVLTLLAIGVVAYYASRITVSVEGMVSAVAAVGKTPGGQIAIVIGAVSLLTLIGLGVAAWIGSRRPARAPS